jgi:TRAP-type C4-dicarboxylate transport system substrate-binding protein
MFQKAATDSAKLLGIEQRNQEAAAKADLISKGMIFNAVDTKPFEALMTPVYDKYFKTHNRVYFDELKAVK